MGIHKDFFHLPRRSPRLSSCPGWATVPMSSMQIQLPTFAQEEEFSGTMEIAIEGRFPDRMCTNLRQCCGSRNFSNCPTAAGRVWLLVGRICQCLKYWNHIYPRRSCVCHMQSAVKAGLLLFLVN